ncbi:hypothetical protein BJY00DRAFT_314774 [Aspergillus carlsbadensis]|nr:hypothetical protein BJY00DRAFT_314774 [Aspergillus carlsbadensis]
MATDAPSLQGNLGFLSALHHVKPDSVQDQVHQLWQAIVCTWFPGREGYLWRMGGSMVDTPVIDVMALEPDHQTAPGSWARRRIFLVESKRPSRVTPSGWDDPLAGRKVRFYSYDEEAAQGQQPGLIPLHQDPIDMSDDDGIAQVENMMNYIKASVGSPNVESVTLRI